MISAKENKKNAVAKQHEEIIKLKEDWKKDFENRNKIQIEINDLKNKIKNIKKEYKSSIVDFLNIFSKKDTQKQSTFLKKIRKRKFIHSTRKSLNPKWKTQSVIDYELKNSIKSWKINTYLYKSNKATGWLFYSLIKNSIIKQKVYDALVSVGLKHEHAYRYPHEFSGGQRQRIVIARALITKPKLIIADEPISALDVSIQSQVINIMKKLAKEQGVTFLFIAHDLSMVYYACNKMIIMHNGRIVEKGDVKSIFKNPIHPYTKSLFKAIPELSRIHINLASFNENLDYYIKYGPLNKPFFKAVNNSKNHFVFGIQEQFDEWMN